MSAATREDPSAVNTLWEETALAAAEARADIVTFFEFVMREQTTKVPMICAPHQRVGLQFMLDHRRSANLWPVGTAKCVHGDTEIIDPATGDVLSIRDLVADKSRKTVWSWSEARGIHAAPITAKHALGTKRCMRITLRSGKSVVTTPEHPYLAPTGWRKAGELAVGDSVATPMAPLPANSPTPIKQHELDLLAVLLADGCTSVPTSVMFSKSDPVFVALATRAADALGCDVTQRSAYDYAIIGRTWRNNPAFEFVKRMGMTGKLSKHKVIPPVIFRLPTDQLARFLSIFWMGDGTVGKVCGPSITLASEKMLRQIQHLLARLGIQSAVTFRPAKCLGKYFDAWKLEVRGCSFAEFAKRIGPEMWGIKKARVIACAARKTNPNLGHPKVSKAFVAAFVAEHAVRGRPSLRAIKRSLGWNAGTGTTIREALFSKERDDGNHGVLPTFFRAFCAARGISRYDWWWRDVFWDEIVSVEDVGEQEIFDLTVSSTACFIANDIIAHNTMSTECVALYLMGRDVTLRGAIVSASEAQATKPLKVVSDYVRYSGELRLVYPDLRPSRRKGDLWTQTAIVVDRPPGIPDPTLSAFGLDTKQILGSRLNWVLLDDLLNEENTHTKDARDKTYRMLDMNVLSRLDPRTGRVIFTNTAFHLEDAIHMVEKLGWATLRMDLMGNIKIQDDAGRAITGGPAWDHHELRPASKSPNEECYRLKSHDPDPHNEVPLWPERFFYAQPGSSEPGKKGYEPAKSWGEAVAMAQAHVDDLRTNTLPHVFAQMYMNECRDDATAMCKLEWVERCKAKAREREIFSMVSEYTGPNPTFTGVDLAFSKGSHADFTAFFTIEALPDGHRRILDVESGQWDGPEVAKRAIDKQRRYNSVLRVEDNAGQKMLIQFAQAQNASLPIKGHRTNKKNKWSPEFGVQSVFLDMYNGAWLIPNDRAGRCHPQMQKWIDECLYFVPTSHSGDLLMSSWFAREQAREFGALVKNSGAQPLSRHSNGSNNTGGLAANIMAR